MPAQVRLLAPLDEKNRHVSLAQDATDATLWTNTGPIELRAGALYSIQLTVSNVRNVVRVEWEWDPKGQGRTPIRPRYLYPLWLYGAFQETYVRFLKAASLAKGVGLTANELAYFATRKDYQINTDGWLNALPAFGNPGPAGSALLKPLTALLDFARLKADLSPDDERLLAVLNDPEAASQKPQAQTQQADSLLYTLTRWDDASLDALLMRFGEVKPDGKADRAALGDLDVFVRVSDAFGIARQMGISASALIASTRNDPESGTVRDLQAALRARYDAADWRDVVQPINDQMRGLQRDALVAYILQQMRSHPESAHIDTPDKLFEYFLMDVLMEPGIETSRIRHALSSVQLFIERCLMNLEPRVSPVVLDAKKWEWMKRYRVWEANRKVYLFPENWLEPELRDDQSSFFKEAMSELLQSDITEDTAATALLNYLSKLDDVAKLEPCGIYHIPAEGNQPEINHVVARTAGAHRKYYYRRDESPSWTPWEQIKLDIEDNPVIPVVWNDRLLLFWLRILKAPIDPKDQATSGLPPPTGGIDKKDESLYALTLPEVKEASKKDAETNIKMKFQAVLCWSEYYNDKWQATKTSDVNKPVLLGQSSPFCFDRSTLKLSSDEPQKGQLRMKIYGECVTSEPPGFLLYNTHSLPVPCSPPLLAMTRGFNTTSSTLTIYYAVFDPRGVVVTDHVVLTDQMDMSVVQPSHETSDIWDAPFFFGDGQNQFYVTTREDLKAFPDTGGYGVSVLPDLTKMIPPLVLPPWLPTPPEFWRIEGPIMRDLGVIDPGPMQRFVTEDAYIHRGIGMTGGVRYGDCLIGPSGLCAASTVNRAKEKVMTNSTTGFHEKALEAEKRRHVESPLGERVHVHLSELFPSLRRRTDRAVEPRIAARHDGCQMAG